MMFITVAFAIWKNIYQKEMINYKSSLHPPIRPSKKKVFEVDSVAYACNPAPGRLRLEDSKFKFKPTLGYTARLSLN